MATDKDRPEDREPVPGTPSGGAETGDAARAAAGEGGAEQAPGTGEPDAETVADFDDGTGAGMPGDEPPRRRLVYRGVKLLLWLAAAAVLAVAGFLSWLDGPDGHRFVIRQIEALHPDNGLRIGIGRIDGSLYRKPVVRDLRLSDPRGAFLAVPEARLAWWPLAALSKRLEIDELTVPSARLLRLPHFNPTPSTGKILPNFDIRIMRFRLDRLTVDKAVAGREQSFFAKGDADVRRGRAVVDLWARAVDGDDRLQLALDSRPDDNRFDVDMTVNAPSGGLLATLAGLKQDANLRLQGKGDWAQWNGRLQATLDNRSALGFDIGLRRGHVAFEGTVMGSALAERGVLARLTSPSLAVKGEGELANRLLSGTVSARSQALSLVAQGGVHLGGHGFDNLRLDIGLLRPQALLRSFDARSLTARLRLNGPFATARFEYRLQADRLRFGRTTIVGVRAAGEGRAAGRDPATGKARALIVPVDLRAGRVLGQGAMADAILRNLRLQGRLKFAGNRLFGGPLSVRTDKLTGALDAGVNFADGHYDIGFRGDLKRLLVQGLGIADLSAHVRLTPDRAGRFTLSGRARAGLRRLDIGFLRTLGGGLPQADAQIALTPDGRLALRDLTVRAPLLTLRGEALRNPDGTVRLTGSGRHGRYGPFRLTLGGALTRPSVDLLLSSPLPSAGLAEVQVRLDPDPAGYRYRTHGHSSLGPFESAGMIEMPPHGQTAVRLDRLLINGMEGTGRLAVVDGGLAGRLLFDGAVGGTVDLAVDGGVQTAVLAMRLRDARFDQGATPVMVRRGRVDATVRLDPAGADISATVLGGGVQVGTLRINRLSAQTHLVNGTGTLTASFNGQRGRLFDLDLDADIAPDAIGFDIKGTLDRQPISLDRRGALRRIDGGWELDPVALRYRGGTAQVNSAAFGTETRFDMALSDMPLSLLDLSNADLGLGGTASGHLAYAQQRGAVPTGSASVTVRGLTRSGVTRTSTPFDLGVNARLDADRLALRAVAAQGGKMIGKAQALMTPLGHGGLMERLRAAPVRAQIRYVGSADTLWRLSTVEIVDIRGDLAISANIAGTGANPIIDGALMTREATLESPVTGMRLTDVRSLARFNGSRLVFSQIGARSGKGGSVTGRGSLDFSLGRGIGMDFRFQANKVEVLDRDDIGATVSGPMTIRSDGAGGVIGGDLDVVTSRFSMGKAAAVAQIPELQIIEKNRRRDDFETPAKAENWRLDITAQARNRLMVDGMGLSSEWGADLKVGGNVVEPRITGRADLVRGTYDFAGKRFDLKEGALRFDGSVPANPTLDITAEATLTDLDATIHITGTSATPEIDFSSTPSMPEDEVLSRLLFGSAITQLSAPEALQLASAVGSLRAGGGGLDPINAVRKAAGLDRLRIIPADTTKKQGTSIGVGKYLTRKIYVELITDGQGYSATQLEYQITRWLSLLSSVSTLGRQTVTARVSKNY